MERQGDRGREGITGRGKGTDSGIGIETWTRSEKGRERGRE